VRHARKLVDRRGGAVEVRLRDGGQHTPRNVHDYQRVAKDVGFGADQEGNVLAGFLA
jgi:hypothetical protein